MLKLSLSPTSNCMPGDVEVIAALNESLKEPAALKVEPAAKGKETRIICTTHLLPTPAE